MDLVGRNNPWAKEWFCPRENCSPCQGRRLLALEEAEETTILLDKSTGKGEVKKKRPEDKVALPSCTGEGVNYVLECYTCRRNGNRRMY